MKFEREFFYDEVRDGFYIPGIIKRTWAVELTVLAELDRICKNTIFLTMLLEGLFLERYEMETLFLGTMISIS